MMLRCVILFIVLLGCSTTYLKTEGVSPAETIELYLQNEVEGLSLSYQGVIDEFIKEGIGIYVYGGTVRDLINSPTNIPNDLDFIFFSELENLINVLKKNGWPYSVKEIRVGTIVMIGNSEKHFMQGISAVDAQIEDFSALGFSCNSIFYDCKSHAFVPEYQVFVEDAINKYMRPTTDDWKHWLYNNKRRHLKIYRTWKMMGKGYTCSEEFMQFVKAEVLGMDPQERAEFEADLYQYLLREYEFFDEIAEAVSEVMGIKWAEQHIYSLRKQIAKEL